MEKVYTVITLASHWDCSVDEVYRLLRQRKLKGFKLGSSWRITQEAVKEFESGDVPEPVHINRPRLSIT